MERNEGFGAEFLQDEIFDTMPRSKVGTEGGISLSSRTSVIDLLTHFTLAMSETPVTERGMTKMRTLCCFKSIPFGLALCLTILR